MAKKKIESKIKRLFILDQETKFLFPEEKGDILILSADQLSKIEDHKDTLEAVIVLAELDWEGRHLQDFYGIPLARKLRIEKSFLCPIIIYSTLSEDFFLDAKKATLDFFKSPGLYFLPLSNWGSLDGIIEGADLIDDLTLLDIAEDFGNRSGIVSSFEHDIKNRFQNFLLDGKDGNEIEELTEAEFARLFMYFKGSEDKVQSIKAAFITSILQSEKPEDSIKEAVNNLNKLIPGKKEQNTVPQYETKWKILFLDDQKDSRKYVADSFKKRGLICEIVPTSEKLYERLKEDEQYNYFTVLICDYRLYEADGKKRCHKQGYSILKEVFQKKPNYLSLFALSSMGSKVLLKFREEYGMKVWSFDKEDIKTESGFNIFTKRVFEEGQKMFATICNLPKEDPKDPTNSEGYSAWFSTHAKLDRPIGYYYRQLRLSEDFEEREESIGKKAAELYYKVTDEPIKHSYSWSAGLESKNSEEAKKKKFEDKLVGRRVYLALRFNKNQDIKEIWHRMKSGGSDKPGEPTHNQLNLFPSHFCMPREIEKKPTLLIEEKYWLKYTIGFDIDEATREAVIEIFSILKDFWDEADIDAENEIIRTLASKFQQSATSLKDLEEILQLFAQISASDEHVAAIKAQLKSRMDELRKSSETGNRQDKHYAKSLLEKFATAGILNLLDRYGLKPARTKADPIRRGSSKKETTNDKKDSSSIFDEGIDPASEEGQERLKGIDLGIEPDPSDDDFDA